jgi:uncharacterized metal-binding protein YceD (DUF177 family)
VQLEVTKLIEAPDGERLAYKLSDEELKLDDLSLSSKANGELALLKTPAALLLEGWVEAELASECHRCLSEFAQQVRVPLKASFSLQPQEDDWPIRLEKGRAYIELADLVREEFILHLPVQALCSEDCLGVCVVCGEVQAEVHSHA